MRRPEGDTELSPVSSIDELLDDMLSSTENYRSAVDKWCLKATDDDYPRWDDELQMRTDR